MVQSAAIVSLLVARARRARSEQTTRETDQKFRLMVDRAPVMIWSARPDTKLDFLNENCVAFSGRPLEVLLGEGWFEVVHPDDLARIQAIYVPALEARTPFTMEYRLRRADGEYRWIIGTGVPHHAANGSYTGYVGCCVDITERKNAEDQSRETQVALALSHAEIQQLAGQLIGAHEDERQHLARELHDDLTQRLARLAIDAGRLEIATGAPEGLRSLREGLIRLSEDVHALSYRLHPSVLDDLGLVEALRTECDLISRRNALRVNVDTRGVPPGVPSDASLCLFRVAQEVLNNTVRHASASTVSVRLSPSSEGLQLAIHDDGRGFDPSEPRERASLGLASMRERVRIQRGTLDIDSAPGRGTSVVAWVPSGLARSVASPP